MKIILKFLISLMFYCGLTSGCQHETAEDSILLEANLIIATYSSRPNFACSSVSDGISYPSPWTKEESERFTIAEDKLESTSTCGLIQTYFNQPWNELGPWCSTCSDLTINGIKYSNDLINQNQVLNELFSRKDAMEKLIERYIYNIQDLGHMEAHPGYLYSFEILLASESMNKILTDSVSDELIILALKMIEVKKGNTEFNTENSFAATRHIITSLLLRKQFTPFLSAWLINGSLETNLYGYKVCYEDEKVESYAKMYLKTKN